MRAIEFYESAADELKRQLPSLKRTDYDTIDKLMRRIGKRYRITGRKLHDIFVSKYGESPDHWIKKYKNTLGENQSEPDMFYIYGNGKPLSKYSNINDAKRDLENIRQKVSNVYFEIRKEVCSIEPIRPSLKEAANAAQQAAIAISMKKAGKKPKNVNEEIESNDDLEKVKDFIKWSIKTLNLKKPLPKIILSKNTKEAQDGHHTGLHTNKDGVSYIWIYVENRNLIDIFRTVFHELVHQKQDQLGMIKNGDSYPGSPIEAMADMLAGKYIKIYGKKHPEIFQ